MRITLKIWRQDGAGDAGRLVTYEVDGVTEDMSFLEMLDVLNEQLNDQGEDPIAFDSDCREGICGMCGLRTESVPGDGRARRPGNRGRSPPARGAR